MARRLRIQFPGALYHVVSRGDRQEAIFRDDADRHRFLETLGEACDRTGWQVHAYVLMPNHVHLVVETPEPNLAAGMKWLLGTYTGRFNRRHGVVGHLFSGRYKSLLVGGSPGYLRTVVEYVHLNPVRAKLIGNRHPIREFKWSSFPAFLNAPENRPAWLRVDRVFGEFGIPKDSPAGRRTLERLLEARRAQEAEADFDRVRHGWFLGDEQFRRELLEQAQGKLRPHHYGPEIHETAEFKAERIVESELSRAGCSEAALRRMAKGDPLKLRIALRLRKETTMTLQWVAQRLHMGTKAHLAHLLYWHRRQSMGSVHSIDHSSNARSPVRKKELEVVTDRSILLTDPKPGSFDPTFD